MTITKRFLGAAMATACAVVFANSALAQNKEDEPGYDRLLGLVDSAMPPVVGNDNSDLVQNLLGVRLGTQLPRSFDFGKARAAIFGLRVVPNLAPDCKRTSTAAGEPDQGECVASVGDENGGETYRSLSFSKNLGVGNIRFLYRPKVADVDIGGLKPVKMSDREAYDKALAFLETSFGVPVKDEVPVPPNAEVLPVRDLLVGVDPQLKIAPVVVQKVVTLRRGLLLPKPFKDPTGGFVQTHVPAPGMARVALNADGNVVGAVVSGWQDLRAGQDIDPRNAKSRSQLVQEIATDLLANGGGPVGSIKILIGLSSQFNGKAGLLLPAVQVYVSPGGRDTEPTGPTSGGIVAEYSLVDFKEGTTNR